MAALTFTSAQAAVVDLPSDWISFLEGPAGAGKTTAAVARLLRMLQDGVPAGAVLILLPQRTLATPYTEALRGPAVPPGGEATVVTLGGLAQRMVELFWPQIAAQAGFAAPQRPPVFLTLETAQYYMARLVGPLLDDGYFESIKVDRNRLYSQILDNLNKAALVGFSHTEIASRLKAAWVGEAAQARVYDEAQECAERFRAYCLAHNLLDFSLQYEVFARHLWPLPACRSYLTGRYTHIIADNIEEDTPVAHDILAEWLPGCRSALLIYDWDAGNRRFLGADPESAYRLKALCGARIVLSESFVGSPDVQTLTDHLSRALGRRSLAQNQMQGAGDERTPEELTLATGPTAPSGTASSPRAALTFTAHRYHPEMLAWVGDEIAGLVHDQGVPPSEIVVLAPFLTGALRFSLAQELTSRGVPFRSHRPSRSLREEPATQCLLTLATLCHPGWGIVPSRFDVAHALMLAIEDLDLVRAQLLADIAYRARDAAPVLLPFVDIEPVMQERITFLLGGRYEGLRTWVAAHSGDDRPSTMDDRRRRSSSIVHRPSSLDHFLSRLFGELLSQPGYGFHRSYDAGEITANLIESVRKFRQVMAPDTGVSHQSSVVSRQSSVPGGAQTSTVTRQASSGQPPNADLPSSIFHLPSSIVSGQPSAVGGQPTPDLGREYVRMVQDGVVAAQYVRSWERQPKDAVLLAPAYTFLMSNRPVSYQFWLDVGGTGWWERLYQPLTHPYVLSRRWAERGQWTDADEFAARQDALAALVIGLLRRCRTKVYLGLSELGAQGSEQRGPLLQAVQRVLRETGEG